MRQVMAFVQQYWYMVLAMTAVSAVFAGYFILYSRAQRPREGTLEWISLYDRPSFSLSGVAHAVTGVDLAPLILVCVLTFFSWNIQIGSALFPAGFQALSEDQQLAVGLNYLLLPTLSVGILYLLIKSLYGRSGIAFLSALILGLDVTWQPAVTFFTLLTTYFTYQHLSKDYDSPTWEMAGSLILIETFFLAACYFSSCMLLYGLCLLACLLVGFCLRFRAGARTGSFGYLLKMLLISALWMALMTILLFVPAGLARGMTLPDMLVSAEFYHMIWLRVNRIAASAFRPSAGLLATAMAYDWVLLCGGTFAVIAMVAAAVRRRKTQGLIVGVWYLGFVALCVLGGGVALPAVCLVALAGVWSSLIDRGRLAMGYLCPAAILLAVALGALLF